MPDKRFFSWRELSVRADFIAGTILQRYAAVSVVRVYAIPNGGIPAALLVAESLAKYRKGMQIQLVDDRELADIYIDDLVDSGKTREAHSDKTFYALINKESEEIKEWCVMPWEAVQKQEGPEDNVLRLLQYIGEDCKRPGLLETPKRVIKSYENYFSGYKNDPKDYVKIFEEKASDAMIILKDVEFYSHCEHHMAPFFGRADLAYIPSIDVTHFGDSVSNKYKVLGASKLSRIFDCFARRLQIQERIGAQFTEFLMNSELAPLGVACRIEATHFCMCSRGIAKQHSKMVTSSLEGVFRKAEVRQEFLSLIKE